MRTSVSIDNRALTRATLRLQKEMSDPSSLMRRLGMAFREDVRQRINSRDNGSWAPASKWTRAKKNTNRALAGQARNIKFRLPNEKRAEVYYEGQSRTTGKDIKITEHHRGKTLAATNKTVSIPIANPRPLGLPAGSSRMYFRWRNNAVVPRRKIWPDAPGEAERIAKPVVSKWINEVVNRSWK